MVKKRATRKKSTSAARGRAAEPGAQRLNKILAAAGLGSRREVEELIVQGRVEIDREIITDLACKVNPQAVTIKVDGELLKKFQPVYYALNKPTGVLSTNRDPSGRMRVIDLVPDYQRVFSVGRLDRSSEGLMLLTNDGELAQRLAHPKFGVQKSYFVVVAGTMTNEELAKLRKGVYLAEGIARIDGATIRRQRKGCTELEIVLSEGKNREIRRLLARAGHKVVVLRRIAIGPLRLGQLPVGAARKLSSTEVQELYASSDPKRKRKPKSKSAGPASRGSAQPEDSDDVEPAQWSDEDSPLIDDDFVGDFSGVSRPGSVLGYEGEAAPSTGATSRPSRKGRARGKSTSGSRSTTRTSASKTHKSAGGSHQKTRAIKKSRAGNPSLRGGEAKSGGRSADSKSSRGTPRGSARTNSKRSGAKRGPRR